MLVYTVTVQGQTIAWEFTDPIRRIGCVTILDEATGIPEVMAAEVCLN